MLITNLEGVNVKCVKFSVHEKSMQKLKNKIILPFACFCYVDKIPYRIYTSKQTSGEHADLLPILTSKNA